MTHNRLPTVLVIGSSGTVGQHLLKELEGTSVNVRIASRKQDVVERLRAEGKESVLLDLDDPRTFGLALANVDRVFLLTGYTVAMLTQSKTLVDAARKAGVSHLVHVGVFAEWDCTDPHFVWHQLIEKYIESSGIAWTHLHPNMFMEALSGLFLPKNLTYTTFFEDRRIGYIAASDIAAVAAKVLVDGPGRHAGQNYWLSTESLNGTEIARLLSEVTGLEIKCEMKGVNDFSRMIESTSFSGEAWYAKGGIEFVRQVLDGRMAYMATVQDDVPYILGRPAKTVREWMLENKQTLTQAARTS
ncbi:NmrA family NAD(P)-binding protein [Melittangium boletus]|uniref:NmrA family NAD(P)-binding protein n=1 Tax=Melittangium boletus TaxID=83453 RepID=UPI003DA3FDAA